MADIRGLEIARPGSYDISTGPLTLTAAMLTNAVDQAKAAGENFRAPVKLGHVDPRFDGEPALGWLHNLRVEGSGADSVLLGDVNGMPDWLANLGPSAFPDRSFEGWVNEEKQTFEVTALALLGVTPPGMSTIRSLRDIPQALGVAATRVPVAASFTAKHDVVVVPPAPVPSGTDYLVALARQAAASDPQTPAPTGAGQTEGSPAVPLTDEQLTKARQRLGLAADADEAAVMAALTADPPTTTTDPATPAEPTATSDPATPPPAPASIAATSAAAAVGVFVDADTLARIQAQATKGEEAYRVMAARERDQVIETAVGDGKIPRSRMAHWVTYWKSDPDGAKAALAAMPKNLVPVAATGYAGGIDDDTADDEFSGLFPPTQKVSG